METQESPLADCKLVKPILRPDNRGHFVKLFQRSVFEELGLESGFNEVLSSTSKKGVVRGLHFQRPPYTQGKLIYCLDGEILDAAVDMRVGSPTYGKHATFHLTAENAHAAWIPPGFAHGFSALTDATVVYMASGGEYNAESDGGIHWDSAGVDWQVDLPILSEKDQGLPKFDEYESPFVYGK